MSVRIVELRGIKGIEVKGIEGRKGDTYKGGMKSKASVDFEPTGLPYL
jgi:hypothetical protein